MNLIYYLLEANLYLLVLYGFYKLLLDRETFYRTNRYFLIFATLTAFLLPLLQASQFHVLPEETVQSVRFPAPIVVPDSGVIPPPPVEPPLTMYDIIPYIYLGIAGILLIKLLVSIGRILTLALQSKRSAIGAQRYLELNKPGENAFSFFNLLFLNPHLEQKNTVIQHEMIHIKQRHSLDIIFFEIVRIVCWFNPVAWLLKTDIKLIHEYLADEGTTVSNTKHEYAMFLIRNSFGVPAHDITNHIFNQSILKRRINMLNKRRSTARARLRLLLLVPLGASMVAFSTMAFAKDYALLDLYPEKYRDKNAEGLLQEVPPPPLMIEKHKNGTYEYVASEHIDPKTKKKVIDDNILIVINGKIAGQKIGRLFGAETYKILTASETQKKYGRKAEGGLEFTGKGIMSFPTTEIPLPPPPVEPPPAKKKVVKFPPPVVKPDEPGTAYFGWHYDPKTKKNTRSTKRLIIINGKKLDDKIQADRDIVGTRKADKVVYLTPADAAAKYGDIAKSGAIEITGNNIDLIKLPPPPAKGVVKFPPPKVVPDKVAPPPPKQDVVKFPPPKVVPDKVAPPPPKKDVVRFPPPKVVPDKVAPKADMIKFPPPKIESDPGVYDVSSVKKELKFQSDSTVKNDDGTFILNGNARVYGAGVIYKGKKIMYDQKTHKITVF